MWKLLTSALLFMLYFQSIHSAEYCLQPGTSGENIVVSDGEDNAALLPNNTQAIITSYRFVDCCGDITEWEAAVEPRDNRHQFGGYTIHFQVWRPSPTVESDGCYSLVGENRFTSITFNGAILSATPEATNRISFQPNDVIGFLSITNENNRNEGIIFDERLSRETVWYHSSGSGSDPLVAGGPACPYPVGPGRTLASFTNQGPAVSAISEISDCTLLLPSSTEDLLSPHTAGSGEVGATKTEQSSATSSPVPTNTLSVTDLPQKLDIATSALLVSSVSPATKSADGSGLIVGIIPGLCVLAVSVVVIFGAVATAIAIHRRKASTAASRGGAVTDPLDLTTTTNESYATSIITSTNPAYGCHEETSSPQQHTAAVLPAMDSHTVSTAMEESIPEYDYILFDNNR